ncbi:hypothetical protein PHYSODRAFT_246637, partial [Phytophthora sojae]
QLSTTPSATLKIPLLASSAITSPEATLMSRHPPPRTTFCTSTAPRGSTPELLLLLASSAITSPEAMQLSSLPPTPVLLLVLLARGSSPRPSSRPYCRCPLLCPAPKLNE